MTHPEQRRTEATVTDMQHAVVPLGMAWQLRVGTVIDGVDPAAVPVTLDGDQSNVIVNAASMVGQLVPGERVYVSQVPPAGQYITGRMIGEERWLDAAIVDTTGTLVTTSAAVESEVSNFRITVPGWQPGKVYMYETQLSLSFSVVTDTFGVRIRRDTALTGTLLAEAFISDAGLSTPKLEWPLRPTATERAVKLFLSVVRTAGTGTCAVLGPNLSSGAVVVRVWSGIRTADALTTRSGGVWRVT